MGVLLTVISDLHIVSTVGLCPPVVRLDDGGIYEPSKGQRWLWDCWEANWSYITNKRDRGNHELWVVVNGDAVDGDHHDTSQIITRNPVPMLEMADEILRPVVSEADRFFMVRGTESHVGGSGAWEEAIARRLGAIPDEETGTSSWWFLPIECEGVKFDFSHHGRISRVVGGKSGSAGRLAAQTMMNYAETGDTPPDVIVYSHVHEFSDSGLNYPVRAFTTPSWQLPNGFAQKMVCSKLPDIGSLIFLCSEGEYSVMPLLCKPERKARWQPS